MFLTFKKYASNIIFQKDKASPHYAILVRTYLDPKLKNTWMGRFGAIMWSIPCPDSTLVTLFSEITGNATILQATAHYSWRQYTTSLCNRNYYGNYTSKLFKIFEIRLLSVI